MSKRLGLGRGLNALIPGPEAEGQPAESLLFCPVSRITSNPVQPRKKFDEAALAALAETIKEKGVLQPLVVRQSGSDYELIAGERRLRAARLAGLTEVPVIVRNASDQDCLMLALIENLQRTDLNPVEEARAYKDLQDRFGMTQEDMALRVGRDRSSVANSIRLLQLPREIQEDLVSGDLTAGHARPLLTLGNAVSQLRVRALIKGKNLSVRETEKLVLELKEGKEEKSAQPGPLDPDIQKIQDELRNYFGALVKIKTRKKGGRILIEYASVEEFDRIYSLMIRRV